MNTISRFIEWRRRVAYQIPLRQMIWLDRCLCVTVSRRFEKTCHDAAGAIDVRPRFFRIVMVNMKSNGPTCTTKRWWVYSRWGAFHIDLDSMFFV